MPEVIASSRLILQMEEIYVGCVGEKATDYCISFVLVFKAHHMYDDFRISSISHVQYCEIGTR